MSFSFNRINNRIPNKNLQINNIPNANNLIQSAGTTNNSNVASISTLSLNNVAINANAEQINSTKVSNFGTVESNKLLILNSNRDITNINNISCTTLIANGQNITASMFQVGESNDIDNAYLTNIFNTGNTLQLKGLITNNSNNISNINSISINSLQLNNNNISVSSNTNKQLIIKQFEDIYPNIHLLNSSYLSNASARNNIAYNFIGSSSNKSLVNNYKWGGLAWSSELGLYVAVASGDSNDIAQLNSVMTSTNGHNWNLQNAAIANAWTNIIWINKLKLFVAVSSSGSNNQIMTSVNGMAWVSRSTPTINIKFTKLIWSNDLNICIAIAKNNNVILYSYNCINWFITGSDLKGDIGLQDITWSSELGLFIACTDGTHNSFYRIVISSNGINWNYLPNVAIPGQPYSISWSSYLNMCVIGNNSTTVISYSYNGFNWNNVSISGISNINIYNIVWIDELKLFVGYYASGSTEYIIYSKNGISWNSIATYTMQGSKSKNIIWSPELGQILISMYEGQSSGATGARIFMINTNFNKKNSNFSFYKNSITFDYNNNRVGINTNVPNKPLEINSSTGECLQLMTFKDNEYTSKFNITNTGQLNINTSKFNINTNYNTYGLKLNNILIKTNINNLNLLPLATNGIAGKQLPLITDSNNNISNINLISCNSLIVNGNNIDTNSNNALFLNNNIGSATANKVLITNSNNNISNINTLSINNIKINNNNLILNTSQSSINYNLTNINNIINNPNIETLYSQYTLNLSNNIRLISTHNATWTSMIWVSELQLFIAIANANSTNSDRIFTSPDGINWTPSIESKLVTANTSWSCLTWSPELNLLVALNTSFSNYYISTSTDGINWYPQYNTSNLNQPWTSICWSSELNLFVAVSSNGSIMVSKNGYFWTLVYQHSTSINLKSIIWANKLNSFIIITNQTSNTQLLISSNGYTWTSINLEISPNTSSELLSITWSEDLNMVLTSTNDNNIFYYSYDGLNWNKYINNGPSLFNIKFNVQWIKDLSLFMIFNSVVSNPFAYSKDGFNWYKSNYNIGILPQAYAWSNDLKRLVVLGSGATAYVFNTLFSTNAMNTIVKQQSNALTINKTNGYIGLGLNASYQLELSTDSAAKPSSSTWTTVSDQRLKEDIEDADLNICYNNFKNINLVRYKWKDNIYSNDQINDRTQLGWIAQDIENILPKSVITCNKFGFEDCKFLNSDQLLSTLYGTVQQLINNFENQKINLDNLQNEISNIDTFLNSLEIDN